MIPSTDPNTKAKKDKSILPSTNRIQAIKDELQVTVDSSTPLNKIKNMKSLSLKPVSLHSTVNLRLSRPTCSSAIKTARNAESLKLNEPKMKLCSYKYCSLHKKEASLPSIKCFLSSKRQSFEPQTIMKKKEGLSKSTKTPFLIEIVDIVNGIDGMMLEDHGETTQMQESCSVTSFEDYADTDSEIWEDEIKVFDECTQQSETEICTEVRKERILKSTMLSYSCEDKLQAFKNGCIQSKVLIFNSPKESTEVQLTKSALLISENPLEEMTNRPKAKSSSMRRTTEDEKNGREIKRRASDCICA